VLIHPYNDWRVIAGQGTAALELLIDVPDLDAVIAPVGGAGLLSGTAIAAKGVRSDILVYGAEPKGADDAQRSLAAGRILPQDNPRTIADGLRTSLGDKTFAVLSRHVRGIGTASEEGIVRANADDVGKAEDHRRAVELGAACVSAREHDRCPRTESRHCVDRRQRRSRPAAMAVVNQRNS
jgi:threonine dehydratase